MKYTLIEKETGKFYGMPVMLDDTSMPINHDMLMYVVLTDNQISSLTNHDTVIDVNNSSFINGAWVESFIIPEKVNILESRTNELNLLKLEADRMLLITDITDSFKLKIEQYRLELNDIIPTNNEIQKIIWPSKPW